MLIPRRVKHRKQHHPSRTGRAKGGTSINFGEYAIQALEPAYVTNRQIESARIAMTRHIRRGGKVWISIYPDRPLTKKPAETRMGSGKGPPEWWVANVKPGRVLFELSGVAEPVAREAMRRAIHKLPMKCRFITGEGGLCCPPVSPLRGGASCPPGSWPRDCVSTRKNGSPCGSSRPPASW